MIIIFHDLYQEEFVNFEFQCFEILHLVGLFFNRYDSFNIKNDIALIKLKNPVDFTKGSVGAVCLPNEYNESGKIESLLTQPTIIGT